MTQHSFRNRVSARLTFAALGVMALMAGRHSLPQQVRTANVVGPEDESKPISVTVWTQPAQQGSFGYGCDQMYDSSSPSYHRFPDA